MDDELKWKEALRHQMFRNHEFHPNSGCDACRKVHDLLNGPEPQAGARDVLASPADASTRRQIECDAILALMGKEPYLAKGHVEDGEYQWKVVADKISVTELRGTADPSLLEPTEGLRALIEKVAQRIVFCNCATEGPALKRCEHVSLAQQLEEHLLPFLEVKESALRAPIESLIAYHEREAKNHVSSQWIYGNHMMAVGAYKKVLGMMDALAANPVQLGKGESDGSDS